jgi:hypothetical protein
LPLIIIYKKTNIAIAVATTPIAELIITDLKLLISFSINEKFITPTQRILANIANNKL